MGTYAGGLVSANDSTCTFSESAMTAGNDNSNAKKSGKQILKDAIKSISFGGYVIGKADITDRDGIEAESNMNIRIVRLYIDGKVMDFKYKVQAHMNGVNIDSKEKSPRIVDAWIEWQKYDFAKIRFGEFKRCFTIENPMHPYDLGAGNYSQLALIFSGYSDRVGEHASNGRDIGLQVEGDLLPVGKGKHNLLHYMVGVFNGQGINNADRNSRKDIMGGLWINPLPNLHFTAYGWTGDYTRDGLTVDRDRFALGVKYDGPIRLRSEYVYSEGKKIGTDSEGNSIITGSNYADAWYAVAGVPVNKNIILWGKYDVYRDNAKWNSTKSLYCFTADYYFNKDIKLQANYTYTYDKAAMAAGKDGCYNTFDLQVYFRF